jgi:hypothetical protein
MLQLNKVDMYWVPSIDNFPNIDADVVQNRTLHAFQYTISDRHKFTERTFTTFVNTVCDNFPRGSISTVLVHFISPVSVDVWEGPGKDSDLDFRVEEKYVTLHFHQLNLTPLGDISNACQLCFRKCFSLFAHVAIRNVELSIKRLRCLPWTTTGNHGGRRRGVRRD